MLDQSRARATFALFLLLQKAYRTCQMPLLVLGLSWLTALAGLFQANPAVWVAYGFVNPSLALLPRVALVAIPGAKQRLNGLWLAPIEILSFLIILVNAPGSLAFHALGFQYDRFLHFTSAFLVMLLAVPLFAPLVTHMPRRDERVKLVAIASMFVFVGLFGFEGVQWSSDRLFGTELFHDATQSINRDVREDLMFGFIGLVTAVVTLRRSPKLWKWLTRGLQVPQDVIVESP